MITVSNGQLECPYVGNPPLFYTWFNVGDDLDNPDRDINAGNERMFGGALPETYHIACRGLNSASNLDTPFAYIKSGGGCSHYIVSIL